MNEAQFQPGPSLVPGVTRPGCVAVIVVPARNEAEALPACLDALNAQCDESGARVPCSRFEILLLLNNCTDTSASVAQRWRVRHKEVQLHLVELTLPPSDANVGTARRLLMDTAWWRLTHTLSNAAILSTDADTVTHSHWLVRNLRALEAGADAVGGAIHLRKQELLRLPASVRLAFERNRLYQKLTAELECLVDSTPGDPAPRHLDHFGASLAFTPEIYARAGGLPHVACLEDVAFVDALRRVDACIRHDPAVQVFTSSRLSARAEMGFANQLRLWNSMERLDEEQRVLSAGFLEHRFQTLATLRQIFMGSSRSSDSPSRTPDPVFGEARRHKFFGEFLAAIDCDSLVERSFHGVHETNVPTANRELARRIAFLHACNEQMMRSARLCNGQLSGAPEDQACNVVSAPI